MNGKHSNTWYSCGFCKFTTSHKKSMKRHMILGKLVGKLLLMVKLLVMTIMVVVH